MPYRDSTLTDSPRKFDRVVKILEANQRGQLIREIQANAAT